MSRLYVTNVSTKGNLQELKDLLSESGKIKFFGINNESGFMVFYKTNPFLLINLNIKRKNLLKFKLNLINK